MRRQYLLATTSVMMAAFAALATPAAAQTPPPADTTVGEVVVTGSYIRGAAENAALPVDAIDAEELQKQGRPTATELIKSLPYTGPVMGESNQFTPTAQARLGAGTINLRGLGAQRTLVLLNGRRFMEGTADTYMLPIGAIGRVEILKDGAAATYGSDAIGGVANFITRKNLDGLELGADYRYVPGSDGDYTLNATWGWATERSNILLSGGYQHRSPLRTTERDWAFPEWTENPTGWSALGNPGPFLPLSAAGLPTAGITRDANCEAQGGVANFTGTTPICTWSYVPYLNLIEKEDRYQLYGEVNSELNDSTRFHAEALYSFSEQPEMRSSPGYPPLSGPAGPGSVGVFSAPISNPGALTALQQAGLSAAQIAATQRVSLLLWRPFATGGGPIDGMGATSKNSYTLFRVSAGVEGTLWEDINWSVAGTYSRSTTHFEIQDVLIDRLQRALNGLGGPGCTGTTPGANGCQYYNPFSNALAGNPAEGLSNPGFVSANANSSEINRWLLGTVTTDSVTDYWVLDAVLSGQLGVELGGGAIGWAAGAQVRGSVYDFSPGPLNDANVNPCPVLGTSACTFRTGPFIFQGQQVAAHLTDRIYAVFGELNLPVTDALNAQLAIRYEDYGGDTGSTTNPKLAIKWQATDWLALRGSVGTTFRGPTAVNRAAGGATVLQGIIAAGNAFKSIDLFGNPAVGPESADTYNVGVIVSAGGLRATVDYWNFKLQDQIVTVPANVIATAIAGAGNGSQFVNCASPLRPLITFSSGNVCTQGVTRAADMQRIRSDTTNGPEVRTSGIDAQVEYRFPDMFAGEVTLAANASYVLKYEQAAFTYEGALVSNAYSALGYTNYDRLPGTISRFRANAYAEYTRGPHNLRLTINYIGGATDNRGPTVIQTASNSGCTVANAGTTAGCSLITFGLRVEPFTTVDLNYRVFLPWDTTLTAGVLNVFDEDPSKARLELSYDPFIGNPYGRTVRVGVVKRF
ncbi:TonB-dependent receptor domain-containing protein [Phenylobacterium sp.]|jgi:iron complex outermembrane receptor protein|uniref:TonB-dependent receptor domain-containing protein n=1 Tax=Phenylobacterium sp. TaxID=1871053 RepID=UPI002F95C216